MSIEKIGEKRVGGQLAPNGEWLVITESTGEEGVGYTHSCGQEIQAVGVTHPIWDGPGPCSGSGQVQTEIVPFCPVCEEEPNRSGVPITPRKGQFL